MLAYLVSFTPAEVRPDDASEVGSHEAWMKTEVVNTMTAMGVMATPAL